MDTLAGAGFVRPSFYQLNFKGPVILHCHRGLSLTVSSSPVKLCRWPPSCLGAAGSQEPLTRSSSRTGLIAASSLGFAQLSPLVHEWRARSFYRNWL